MTFLISFECLKKTILFIAAVSTIIHPCFVYGLEDTAAGGVVDSERSALDTRNNEQGYGEAGRHDETAISAHETAQRKAPTLNEYVSETPRLAVGSIGRAFSRDTFPLAVVGLGLTGLALTVDNETKDFFQERRPLERLSNIGDVMGAVSVHAGIGATVFVTGLLLESRKTADTGFVMIEALLINAAATEGLKYAVGRERPDGSDDKSFPSGHASSTAALAASLSELSGWDPGVSLPLYLATAFVGAARLEENEHFLSDVIGGMAIGTIIGMSVARQHGEMTGVRRFVIAPRRDRDFAGIAAGMRF